MGNKKMSKCHFKTGYFRLAWIFFFCCAVQTGFISNVCGINDINKSISSDISKRDFHGSNSEPSSEQGRLEAQKDTYTGEITKSTFDDLRENTDTSSGYIITTKSSNNNVFHSNIQTFLSTSLSNRETVKVSTLVPQALEIAEDGASCRQKCGQIQKFPCSCDLKCLIHKNCCEDMAVVCPEKLQESQLRYGHMLDMKVECAAENIFLITGCGSTTTSEEDAERLLFIQADKTNIKTITDFIINAYVTDSTTGFVYKNWDVFSCAAMESSNPVKWGFTFKGSGSLHLTNLRDIIDSIPGLQRPYQSAPVELGQNLSGAPCVQKAIGTCQAGWMHDPETVSRCQEFISYVTRPGSGQIYRNKYCALCNHLSLMDQESIISYIDLRKHEYELSLTITLSGNSLKVVTKHYSALYVATTCELTNLSYTDLGHVENICSSENCDLESVRRPDGVCKRIYYAMVAVSDEGSPFTADDYDMFPEFLRCFIKSHIPEQDISDDFYRTVPVFDSRLNITLFTTRMFGYQAGRLPDGGHGIFSPQAYSKLSLFAQLFKAHRKSKTSIFYYLHTPSQLPETRSSELSERYIAPLNGSNSTKTISPKRTIICLCSDSFDSSTHIVYTSCGLQCIPAVDIEDQETLFGATLTNLCPSLSGSKRGAAGESGAAGAAQAAITFTLMVSVLQSMFSFVCLGAADA